MISQIHIKNFKSIVDLTLDLGRVNLFIGENGSGKSNILEAVAFAESTNGGLVSPSILYNKGARIADGEYYRSMFQFLGSPIVVNFVDDGVTIERKFTFDEEEGWFDTNTLDSQMSLYKLIKDTSIYVDSFYDLILEDSNEPFRIDIQKLSKSFNPEISDQEKERLINDWIGSENYKKYSLLFSDFIIYSPEVSSLRKFEEEGQVRPLGVKGEGLFSLIKSLAKDNGSLKHIKEHMEAIDWFEDFSIPGDLMSNEYKIAIKDRFINSEIAYLDQRSANEGFLFLLFYVVLFSSKKTPQFFAIDNIEASFNPKLCAKLIDTLVKLSRKNDKQVLMTTHNPATLDGLDLNDPEQRLFVVRRNIDGHTIATRIFEKPQLTTPMKLSEMWTKGFLGGLPENF